MGREHATLGGSHIRTGFLFLVKAVYHWSSLELPLSLLYSVQMWKPLFRESVCWYGSVILGADVGRMSGSAHEGEHTRGCWREHTDERTRALLTHVCTEFNPRMAQLLRNPAGGLRAIPLGRGETTTCAPQCALRNVPSKMFPPKCTLHNVHTCIYTRTLITERQYS